MGRHEWSKTYLFNSLHRFQTVILLYFCFHLKVHGNNVILKVLMGQLCQRHVPILQCHFIIRWEDGKVWMLNVCPNERIILMQAKLKADNMNSYTYREREREDVWISFNSVLLRKFKLILQIAAVKCNFRNGGRSLNTVLFKQLICSDIFNASEMLKDIKLVSSTKTFQAKTIFKILYCRNLQLLSHRLSRILVNTETFWGFIYLPSYYLAKFWNLILPIFVLLLLKFSVL